MWDRLGITDLPVHYEFIETPVFARRLGELASNETLQAIQSDLIENPERWPVVRGFAGCPKRTSRRPPWKEWRIPLYLPLLAACGTNLFVVSVWKERASKPFAGSGQSLRQGDSKNKRRGFRWSARKLRNHT